MPKIAGSIRMNYDPALIQLLRNDEMYTLGRNYGQATRRLVRTVSAERPSDARINQKTGLTRNIFRILSLTCI